MLLHKADHCHPHKADHCHPHKADHCHPYRHTREEDHIYTGSGGLMCTIVS